LTHGYRAEHYRTHLAPVYIWMAGGVAVPSLAANPRSPPSSRICRPAARAVDLGAGFGMHAIPLGRRGCAVLAVDSCSVLLEELMRQSTGLPVKAVHGRNTVLPAAHGLLPDAILCMGDTLTHLPDTASVLQLFAMAAESCARGGRFIATFRDYTAPLLGRSAPSSR